MPAHLGRHTPDRPSWTCVACHWQWPCRPARLYLLAAYRLDLLGAVQVMANAMIDAIHDGLPGYILWPRFVGWARRAYVVNARRGSA